MPGYDDLGFGCDNDLNNYNHNGSSVLNDGGDSGSSSGFSWADLLSSGNNGNNSGDSYTRSGNPYQPYMPQTNYTNTFTPQGNTADYSSYGNNANFQQPAKPTVPKQTQNSYNPGKPVLNNQVTNNRNTTELDVLDTGNLLGKNPLKKNVTTTDVLDAKSKTFFERLIDEPLSYFPEYHPKDDVLGYDYDDNKSTQNGVFTGTYIFSKDGVLLGQVSDGKQRVYVLDGNLSLEDFGRVMSFTMELENLSIDQAASRFGTFYDLTSFSKAYDMYGEAALARKIGDDEISNIKKIELNGKDFVPYAEVMVRLILTDNNTITIGDKVAPSKNLLFSSPHEVDPAASYLNTHGLPKGKLTWITLDNQLMEYDVDYGPDLDDLRTVSGKYRLVTVDKDYIYIYTVD